jgi:NAD(P)-dependent dehydrogenase (short-subunit alcohol dehydrogenase family)
MGAFAGRTVIVTGGARGQGAAEVAALAREGADVVAADILEQEGLELERALAGSPGTVTFRRLDVSSPEDWQELIAWLRERDAVVHGLVNNAGIAHRARLDDVTLEGWNRTLAVNLTGAMLGIQACVPLMREGGSIVNVGSVAALTGYPAVAYTASKWGLRGLSHVAALQYGGRGIRTNIVHPGYIETPILADAPQAFLDASLALTPAGRTGSADEVALLVVFLLSDQAAYINGAEISIDGGYASQGGAKVIADWLARSEKAEGPA